MTVQEEISASNQTSSGEYPPEPDNIPVVRVEPPSGLFSLGIPELWEYRELLLFFVWRDIKIRYKQTVIGAAWALIQPFFTMVVFSIFFGWLAGVQSNGVPYPIFSYAALVPWMYFANSLSLASTSLVEQERLLTKVYFPRLLVPMAPSLAGLLDFSIAFTVLIVMMFAYGITPTLRILATPLLILLAMGTAMGVGFWLSALNVQYRDVRFAIPFLIQFWLFATPIAYPSSLVPEMWRPLYGLNPMAGVVEGFRWALLGSTPAPGPLLTVSVLVVLGLLISGIWYFKRMEGEFADIV